MIIGINKPPDMTSHDVVNKVRKITGEKRVGHGGTLDPFATGVLVIGITRESTKKLAEVLKNTDKEYIATLELGKTSDTGDTEGKIKNLNKDLSELTKEDIERVLENFRGEIMQTPPSYSAIKVNGERAYKLAREGRKVKLQKRKVNIKKLVIEKFDPPYLTLRTLVSSGTYIRSLATDIGESLGTGAYLKKLVRTKVGTFTLDKSITLSELEKTIHPHT